SPGTAGPRSSPIFSRGSGGLIAPTWECRPFRSRSALGGANGHANLFDQHFAIRSHLVVHHDDAEVVRRLATKAQRGLLVGNDDVGAESAHDAQRVIDGAACRDSKPKLGENCLGLSDDGSAFAYKEDEWRKAAGIGAASSATGLSAAVRYTSEVRCLWHFSLFPFAFSLFPLSPGRLPVVHDERPQRVPRTRDDVLAAVELIRDGAV